MVSSKKTLDHRLFQSPFSRVYWRLAAAEFKDVRMLVFAALMIALRVALKPVKITIATDVSINTAFIANAFGAMVFGPVVAIPAAAISDLLGYLVAPEGLYFPPFILTEIAGSVIFALFLYRTEITTGRLLLSKFCVNFFVNIVMTPPIMRWYYAWRGMSTAYPLLDGLRIVKNIVMLPLEAVVLVLVFQALMPPMQKLGFVKSTCDRLTITRRHAALLVALVLFSAAAVGGYWVYDYNQKSFSASYTQAERLQRNTEMNAWVAAENPALDEETLVTVILSARSQVGNPHMTYELAVYRVDEAAFLANQAQKLEKDPKAVYTLSTLRGYSKSPASKDSALILIGSGTAVTDKHTGQHLTLDLQWTQTPKNGDDAP